MQYHISACCLAHQACLSVLDLAMASSIGEEELSVVQNPDEAFKADASTDRDLQQRRPWASDAHFFTKQALLFFRSVLKRQTSIGNRKQGLKELSGGDSSHA